MSEKSGFGSFFAGLLTGAAIGAVATILYAPNSGEETRASLNEKKDDIVDKANISVDDAYKAAETAAREARDRFDTLAATTRKRAEDITRRGQVILEDQINNIKKNSADVIDAEEVDEILMPTDVEETAEAAAETVEEAKEAAEEEPQKDA